MQSETKFKMKVQEFLKTLPKTWFVKIQQVGIRGTPDIFVCVNSWFVAMELKTDEGVLSELQKYNLERIDACGGYAWVVTPATWGKAERWLTNLARQKR